MHGTRRRVAVDLARAERRAEAAGVTAAFGESLSQFVLRVDDVGWTARPIDPAPLKAPDVGLELAQRFHRALGGIPYLAGLIPATIRHDDEAQAWLASKPEGM